jgi:hypothetical protein
MCQSLSDLIEGRLSSPDGRAELIELTTRLIVGEALEAERRDALGRKHYEHGAAPGQDYRNEVRSEQNSPAGLEFDQSNEMESKDREGQRHAETELALHPCISGCGRCGGRIASCRLIVRGKRSNKHCKHRRHHASHSGTRK